MFFKKKFNKPILAAVPVLMLLLVLPYLILQAQEHKPLEYQVEVKATLVPLFVVDSRGNPVFDLKEEELELYVDGNRVDIYNMEVYRFETSEKVEETAKAREERKDPSRVIFVVLDSLNSTFHGLDKSKRIAVELIERANPGDMFVVLEVTLQNGLKYLAGPEPRSDELIKKVKKLRMTPGQTVGEDFLTEHAARIAVNHFVHSISQLKYALKTITKPKIMYLISEGISERTWEREYGYQTYAASTVMFYFGDLIKAINQGGCVFNVIYPGRVTSINEVSDRFFAPSIYMPPADWRMRLSSEWMLKYVGIGSGGAFFNNPDVKDLVTSVKQVTSAYYELAFQEKQGMKQRHNIVVKSKRKDVIIHTLVFSEAEKDYKEMESVQKKVFAINVVTEGSWSRMVGKVQMTKYRTVQKQKQGKEKYYKIEVPVPEEMRNKKADIFLLRFDKSYEHSDINLLDKELGEQEVLEIESKKGKSLLYFVIIDPESANTIYARVK
jgi:VWFA-related protein